MQSSTFIWIITAMVAGHALAMPRGVGGNNNGNSNGKLVLRCETPSPDCRLTARKAAASGASTDGQTCEGGTGNIIDTGVCKNGRCNIEIPPNELSIVASADCE